MKHTPYDVYQVGSEFPVSQRERGPINTLSHNRYRRRACKPALSADNMACAAQVRSLGSALEGRGWHTGHMGPAGIDRLPAALHDGAQCETVQALTSVHTGLLSARVCRNLTHGQLIADYSNATERVVLLRVGGPHPQTVIFERAVAARSQWIAPFRTCTPGTYTLHVLFLTLDPWGQGELGFEKRCNIHHTPEAVLVRNMSFWTAGAQLRDARARCQGCLWSWNDPTHDWEARALFSHFAPMPHPYRFEMARRFRELRWTEPAIAPSETRSFSTPADRLPLCLVGDSHMRNLANMLVASNRSDCDVVVMQSTKSVCNSSTKMVRHFRANEPSGALKLMKGYANMSKLRGCKAIIASFGQWQISDERAMHSLPPYSPARYATKLRPVLNSLRKLGETLRVPVAWMPINPMPLTKGLLSNFDEAGKRVKLPTFVKRGSKTVLCPPTHWIMPHIARALNAAAQKAAAAAGVAVLDTWHMILPLIDTSFDGQHYGTPAVTPVTWMIKTWLQQQGPEAGLVFGPRQRRAAQRRGAYG